nr:E3 ubiquitin-protein ligase RNF12-like [Ipomoea trifida]
MERESGSNNGTPRFRPVRLFGVEITLPENGDNRQQPTELQQVENGLREATGGNIDPDMVDAVIQLIVDTLESLEDNADHDDILNVHLSIQLEEVMEDSLDAQEDHPGWSEEVIMSLLGTSTFETSSDEDKDSCCICLDEFSTGDELGKINCEHKFHFMCIREWLKRNNICPICRVVALSVS